MSDEQFSLLSIPRDPDVGMRLAHLQLLDEGALSMTERSLLWFHGDLRQTWRLDEDFSGWEFEAVEKSAVHMVSSDWSGHEHRQVRFLANGLEAVLRASRLRLSRAHRAVASLLAPSALTMLSIGARHRGGARSGGR
jgi:hypothetical protein